MKQAEQHGATGRRKTSVARVWMQSGNGTFIVNKRDINQYYVRDTSKMIIMQPLELTDSVSTFDIKVNVQGGGLNGQAGAIRHGIARVLAAMDNEWRKILKKHGLLTRDARKKERKLPGQPGARKRFQYSKR
ncbi:MAG: 30S ribosomal protein S9 [Pseudomonadota bacterium]|nr:30S ribosomal protein S9 [Pseudomonadota bacterium]